MRKVFFNLRSFILFLSALLFLSSCFLGYVYYKVTKDAAKSIERGAVARILASESPVYYDDGVTPIGVFFEKNHSKFISYREIPKIFVKAIVATEDKNFFHHVGFDYRAIFRAILTNIKAGRVVQGGSTITQQTAKNIFRRERRSYAAKLKELIQAFLLERIYTKEEILEMYANQFFVLGYGKGLGIASQYFFNKEPKDLDLVEAAFIAGSVKGPNRFNPFIKKNPVERERAKYLAGSRKDHVLSCMYKMHFISREQYLEAKARPVPFKEGRITYRLNVILDYIREQLESDYFKDILQEQGMNNIAVSGMSIYTSINKEIQDAALNSLRRHLPMLEVRLSGYGPGPGYEKTKATSRDEEQRSGSSLPFLAKITDINSDRERGALVVSWENGGGIIDYDGLKSMGEAWIKWKNGQWAEFDKRWVPAFLKNFQLGDLVPVQIEGSSQGKDEKRLVLSRIPELDGGVVVIQNGMIKAMVGGYLDRFFNRTVDARRQLGSIFKPFVFAAALQLKWNLLDPLNNRRDIYKFENTRYVPRPDHPPETDSVSLAWAGVKSENLAAVWLLYHLADRLTMSEFRKVTDLVGLTRGKQESYSDYTRRIRDQYGVVVNREALAEAAFEESKKEVESDIIFAGREKIVENLNRLHFDIDPKGLDLESPEETDILRYSFKRLREHGVRMEQDLQEITRILTQSPQTDSNGLRKRMSEYLHNFYRTREGIQPGKFVYTLNPESLSPNQFVKVKPEWVLRTNTSLAHMEIWIDDLFTPDLLDLIHRHTRENLNKLLQREPYDLQVLSKVRDFRTLVSLLYVVLVSKNIGISTQLDPVLSFPLGPNSISIIEAALAYQAIMTGKAYPLYPDSGPTMVPVITKILDREGEILWEYKPMPEEIFSESISCSITEILRKVMELGTGRKARDAVRLFQIPIPLFGKTGTANRFTNSSFVGLVPSPDPKTGRFHTKQGYIIANYVGYDDNRPMKGKHFAVYGASGALPLWIDTANAIVGSRDYRKDLQFADLVFTLKSEPVQTSDEFLKISVSPVTGLPVALFKKGADSTGSPVISAEAKKQGDSWKLTRKFEPFVGAVQ
jgi:penicillin-binding protein 1A